VPADNADERAPADSTDPSEPADPTEKADAAEPIDPTERNEPFDAMFSGRVDCRARDPEVRSSGDTSLTMGSARFELSVRRAASLGNHGTTAVRAVRRLDLHPAVAGEERSERIPGAMRPSLCGHRAVTLLAVHDTAHLRGHRVPAYRVNGGSKRSGCRPRELVEH
jgi:hypothetical protein